MSTDELTEEEEQRLIDKIAKGVHDRGLGDAAILFLHSTWPLSFVASQLAIVALAPLYMMFDLDLPKYTSFFAKKENGNRIIDRIEELSKVKPEQS